MATGGGVYIQLSLNSSLTLYYSYQIGAILVISNTRISQSSFLRLANDEKEFRQEKDEQEEIKNKTKQKNPSLCLFLQVLVTKEKLEVLRQRKMLLEVCEEERGKLAHTSLG